MMGQPVMHNKDFIISNFPFFFYKTGQNKGAILLGDLEINMTTDLIFLQTLDTLIVTENLIMQIRKNPAQDKNDDGNTNNDNDNGKCRSGKIHPRMPFTLFKFPTLFGSRWGVVRAFVLSIGS